MRIISVVHFYPPYRNAGSERMLHTMNMALVQAGHEVKVIVTSMEEAGNDPYEFEGIEVIPGQPLRAGIMKPDVLISHHQNARAVVGMSRVMGCKSVIILHNDFPQSRGLLRMRPDLTVYNTQWLADKFEKIRDGQKTMVFHPPVWVEDHYVSHRLSTFITLVNLNKDKGSHIFYRIAKELPKEQFLGVTGAHGEQYIPEEGVGENVVILPHQKDMRLVWQNTGIVVMPSIYESYGMVGPEAFASGIPVIASPTLGLKESLGSAGYFVRRNDVQGWVKAIQMIRENYDEWMEKALNRSAQLSPQEELQEWVKQIEALG